MYIRLGYEMIFEAPVPTPIALMLSTHPSVAAHLCAPDEIHIEPNIPIHEYIDGFGNRCGRILAPAGTLRLWNDTVIEAPDTPDEIHWEARQHPIEELPDETLPYLLASRYCEVDAMGNLAWELFGNSPMGWGRVQAICDWVHNHVEFGYSYARPTKTAQDVYNEGNGVCRDYQHLAITFCRCLNIPARYATGYLGDVRIPVLPGPMDFSAWFQVYLGGRWYDFDARFNTPRYGRTLMATGRDAVDVALTTSFGATDLKSFVVWATEVESLEQPLGDLPRPYDWTSISIP